MGDEGDYCKCLQRECHRRGHSKREKDRERQILREVKDPIFLCQKSDIKVERECRQGQEKSIGSHKKTNKKEYYRSPNRWVLRQWEWWTLSFSTDMLAYTYLAWLKIVFHTVLKAFAFGLQWCDYETVANKMGRVANSFASTKTIKKTESSIISSDIKNYISKDYYINNKILL